MKNEQWVCEFADNELKIMTTAEIEAAEVSAEEFDGFLGFAILGRLVVNAEDPEPLDPHTCELCVGDEVEEIGSLDNGMPVYSKVIGVVLEYKGMVSSPITEHERHGVKLIHRHGATIKEVGDE